MEHIKTFFSMEKETKHGTVIVEGPVDAETLASYTLHEDLKAFRLPKQQHEALISIAALPEGRIIVVRQNDLVVGYVTYLYPDPLERWSDGNLEYLIELGAIEISLPYRHLHLGSKLIRLSLTADEYEDYIVLTTEYYWHWDLKNASLDVYAYKKLMQK